MRLIFVNDVERFSLRSSLVTKRSPPTVSSPFPGEIGHHVLRMTDEMSKSYPTAKLPSHPSLLPFPQNKLHQDVKKHLILLL